MPHVELKFLPVRRTWVHPHFLVVFVLLNLKVFFVILCRSSLFLFVPFLLAIVLPDYGFWLPLWYLQTSCLSFFDLRILITPLVSSNFLPVLLWFTDSDYPFGIFKLLACPSLIYGLWLPLWYLQTSCLSFFDLRILITTLVASNFLPVLLWITDSDYNFGSLKLFL